MVLFRLSHSPAGATTLVISLGIIFQPKELVIIVVAVALLTTQAFAIDQHAVLPYPLWKSPPFAGKFSLVVLNVSCPKRGFAQHKSAHEHNHS